MLTIRPATIADVPEILSMLQDSACDQGFAGEVCVSEAELKADGFGANPRFQSIVAEWNAQPAGIALFFFIYSSWGSKNVLYLEDLYVRPEFRKKGIARSLLRRLGHIAAANGAGRMQWIVNASNTSAIRVYQASGAKLLDDWRLMSIKGQGIDTLATTD